ncbi:acetyltransferase [Aureimonas endophytica]|uniref:Acetyltransferase n=1 Tax=Aureimonas endophytica TaxID=2027858 RepID=A0A916ZT43_9HYPH|nr:GNAT family N-acetyltransferase [Aureimonas endophytica]GGE12899.1 acetyltransferase [Aureimonas endophytica]
MNDTILSHPSASLELLIRAGRPDDAEALTDLANLPAYRHGTMRLPFQRVDETRRWLEGHKDGDVHLVALRDGRLVGSAGLSVLAGRRRHTAVLGMGVHDDHRRQGIGAALIGALLDVADRWLDLKRVELTVFADNAPALALYAKFGFEREGLLRAFAFRDGAYADAVAMARLS